MTAPMTFIYETSKLRLQRIVELLKDNPEGLTRSQLAYATEIGSIALYCYLKKLAGDDIAKRQIRIGAWNRQLGKQGNFEAVYFAGDEPDAPRPPPLTPAERARRHRASRKRRAATCEAAQ